MAKRKSLNRKRARYSRSSVGSAVLDPDMDVIDDDRAYWWKELDNNTARYSMRTKVFNETSRHLNSASSINDVEEENEASVNKEWWKALEESRSGSILQARMDRREDENLQTEAEQKPVESSASESEEEIRTKKRKLPLREVAPTKSIEENAFLMALHSSKESIASEPVSRRTPVQSAKDTIVSDSAIPSGKAKTSIEKRTVHSKGQEDSGNQSRTMTDIVKPRPRIFGKRDNQEKNVFQDVLDNTPESPFKIPSKSPIRAKHGRTPTSEIPRRSVANDTPIAYQKRLSRLDLSFDTDSEKSLNLSVPKAQSTVIEATPSRRKPSESDSESEILKPKSRMLKRLRKSLGQNAFDEIIMENTNESYESKTEPNRTAPSGRSPVKEPSGTSTAMTRTQNQTQHEQTDKRSFRQAETDRSKKDTRAESVFSRRSSDISSSPSRTTEELSTTEDEAPKDTERTLTNTRAKSVSGLQQGSSPGEEKSSKENQVEEVASSDTGVSGTSESSIEIARARSPSADCETDKDELARPATAKKQNATLISKPRKEIEGGTNYPSSDNGSDQIVLRYSEGDNFDTDSVATSRKTRSRQKSSFQETRKSSARFSEVEEADDMSANGERSGKASKRRASRSVADVDIDSEADGSNVHSAREEDTLNISRRSDASVLGRESSARERSKRSTLSKEADESSTRSDRVPVSVRRSKSIFGNKSARASLSTIWDEELEEESGIDEEEPDRGGRPTGRSRSHRATLDQASDDEAATERNLELPSTSGQSTRSITGKRSTLEDRTKRSTLTRGLHELTAENTERDEERLNTSRQSAEAIASKRSTLVNRTTRSTLAKTQDELREENTERDEEPLNTSRQSAASIASKRSTLVNRTTRSTLAKTQDELIEENTERDEEPLNTSRQSAASIASKRSTLASRTTRSTLAKTQDELIEENTERDEEPLNTTRESAASIASKRSTLGNRTTRSTLVKTRNELIEENTERDEEPLNTSRQSAASPMSKRSTLGNRTTRSTLVKTRNELIEENTERDEEPLNTSRESAASPMSKRSTLDNRTKRSTLTKSLHELTAENTERNEEPLNTSRQSAASIASKRSTLGNRTTRSTLIKTRNELIEENTERDEEPLNTSRQSAPSIASKRSTLGNKTTRSTLVKTRNELIEENTKRDEEPLNTSRQSAASIASKRSTLGNRATRSTLSRTDLGKINENTEKDEESLNSPERFKAPSRRERSVLERSKRSFLGTTPDRVSAVSRSNKTGVVEESEPSYIDSDENQTSDSDGEQSGLATPRKSERLSSLRRRLNMSDGSSKTEAQAAEDDEQAVQSSQEEEEPEDEGRRPVEKESETNRPSDTLPNRNQRVSITVDDNTRARISVRESEGPIGAKRKSSIKVPSAGRKSVSGKKSLGQKTQLLLDWFLKERVDGGKSKPLSGNLQSSEFKRKLDEIKSQTIASPEKRLDEQNSRGLKLVVESLMTKKRKLPNPSGTPEKKVNKAYLVNGKPYKPPRLPRPKEWVTDRLYRFLWKTMEPSYGISARVCSEKFIVQLSNVMAQVEKAREYKQYQARLENLIREMARLGIIRTRNDFYHFSYDYLPKSLWAKVTPMLLPGNKRNIPYDPDTLDEPIIRSS